MTLLSFLPVLAGWFYSPTDIDVTFSVEAGKERLIEESARAGWFVSGSAAFSNPDAELVIEYYDAYGRKLSIDMRPKALYEFGLTSPNATGVFCPKYIDGPPPVYVVVYLPVNPLPFKRRYRLLVRAPAGASVTVYNYSHLLALIADEEAFIKSLQRVLGTAKQVEELVSPIV